MELAKVHKTAKRSKADFQRACRRRWMKTVVAELDSSADEANWSRFYWLLRRIGVVVKGTSAEGRADLSPQQLRQHALKVGTQVEPSVDHALIDAEVPAQPTDESLGVPPTDEEFFNAVFSLRESAPGPDQVTALMLRSAGPRALWQVRLLVHQLWNTDASEWEASTKQVVGIPLYKGDGSRADLDNYRYIMLISVISRVLGRIIAARLQRWAETQNHYGEWQWGFRRGRSVVDVRLLIRTMVELASSVPVEEAEKTGERYNNLVLIMFDIMKAHSKVQRGPAWYAFEKMGIPTALLRVLSALHDHSEYRMKTAGGESDAFLMPLGFREGCCSSPGLYNLWHCLAMKHYRKLEEQTLTEEELESLMASGLPKRPFHLRVRAHPSSSTTQRVDASISSCRLGRVTSDLRR